MLGETHASRNTVVENGLESILDVTLALLIANLSPNMWIDQLRRSFTRKCDTVPQLNSSIWCRYTAFSEMQMDVWVQFCKAVYFRVVAGLRLSNLLSRWVAVLLTEEALNYSALWHNVRWAQPQYQSISYFTLRHKVFCCTLPRNASVELFV